MNTTTLSSKPKNVLQHVPSIALFTSMFLISACGSSGSSDPVITEQEENIKTFTIQVGSDLNTKDNPLLSLNPEGPGGSSNQSLRAGDILQGDAYDDLLIGGLGVDVLIGDAGDDILIGGTEDFNSSVDGDDTGADNRDRAFGQSGDDLFIWSPGDGSDFFDGGEGTDVIIFGILGELSERINGEIITEGAPFFNVNASGEGSKDFDGIFTNEHGQPQVRVSNTPGFCSLVDAQENAESLAELALDQIVRFSLRDTANAFEAGEQNDDDGLRVAVSLKNTEYVVCTRRDFNAESGFNNIEVLDIRSGVPVVAEISDLPTHIQSLIL